MQARFPLRSWPRRCTSRIFSAVFSGNASVESCWTAKLARSLGKVFRMCRSCSPMPATMLSSPARGLDALGLKHIDPVHVQQMDSVDYIGEMQEVGRAVAEQKVKAEHVAGFLEAS